MGRHVSGRLLEAVGILEKIGPCRAQEVQKRMQNLGKDNAIKYLNRGVDRGWVTVSGALYQRVYAIVPGWSGAVKPAGTKGVFERVQPQIPAVHPLQAVWM